MRTYYGWTIVAALGITTIVSYGTSQYLIGVLVAPIASEMGWDKAAINVAYSLTVLMSGLLGFSVGRALDRFGARTLMSAGSIVLGVSLVLMSRVHSLGEFYAIWGLGIGVGTALTYYPVSFTVVANWFERKRISALSLLTFLGALSSTFFYPLNGILTAVFGWREAVAILGGIQLAVTLPLHAILLRRHPEDIGLHPDGAERTMQPSDAVIGGMLLSEALRTRAFWLVTAALSLSFFAATTITVEHIAFLISRGFAPTLVTTLVGLWGLAYLPGRTIVASAGRLPLHVLMTVFIALEGVGVAILLNANSVAAIVAYLLVFAGAYGAIAPLRAAIMAEHFGRRAYGSIITAQGIPIAILAALGPIVCGRLIDLFGYATSFVGCIIALGIGSLLMLIPMRSSLSERANLA